MNLLDVTNLQKSTASRLQPPGDGRRTGVSLRCLRIAAILLGAGLAGMLTSSAARAVSCTTQSQMAAPDRDELASATTRLASLVVTANTTALRAATLSSVSAQFDGIAATVESMAPSLRGATVSIENLYALHADDLKASDEEAQFFCSVPGAPLLVTVSIPQLPPGSYALAIVHATGVANPQQLGLILARGTGPASQPGPWLLAGFFARPLTLAGHDGLWYWSHARDLTQANQRWSAYFYYQSAQFLLTPVDFLSSPNLAKLEREEAKVRPEGLPGEGSPTTTIAAGDQSFTLTSMRTDGSLGGLDLVLHYNANAASVDPVFARAQALQLMNAILQQHAELRANFHGLWVYADSPARAPFAVELPMDQIH